VAAKSSKRKETINDSAGGGLSKARAKAQEIREAEFVSMLGLSTLTEREKLEQEIVAQVRIITSNQAGLELTTLSATDRRYLLFAAVQKAKVSTEGVKVIALLMECLGAKAMESDTFIEMALRDAQLIPAVEGSTHVNLGLTAQFLNRYFYRPRRNLPSPPSMTLGEITGENSFLFEAKSGATGAVPFAPFLRAYAGFRQIPNVHLFARQAHAFRGFLHARRIRKVPAPDLEMNLLLGQILATIAYAQVIAENASRQNLAAAIVSAVFHPLIIDLTAIAVALEALPQLESADRAIVHRMLIAPQTSREDWNHVAALLA